VIQEIMFLIVNCALPTPVTPTSGVTRDDWLSYVLGWADDTVTALSLVIAMFVFLFTSWSLLVKFNEARQVRRPYGGKKSISLGHWADVRTPKKGATEWGEVGLLAILNGCLLVVIVYLLSQMVNIV